MIIQIQKPTKIDLFLRYLLTKVIIKKQLFFRESVLGLFYLGSDPSQLHLDPHRCDNSIENNVKDLLASLLVLQVYEARRLLSQYYKVRVYATRRSCSRKTCIASVVSLIVFLIFIFCNNKIDRSDKFLLKLKKKIVCSCHLLQNTKYIIDG